LEFSRIVHETWKDPSFLPETEVQKRLVAKLKLIKQRVKKWAQQQRSQKFLKLDKLEEDLLRCYQEKSRGQMSREVEEHINSLEKELEQYIIGRGRTLETTEPSYLDQKWRSEH
jgi:hypothetical protein